jgi:hypothetical protein
MILLSSWWQLFTQVEDDILFRSSVPDLAALLTFILSNLSIDFLCMIFHEIMESPPLILVEAIVEEANVISVIFETIVNEEDLKLVQICQNFLLDLFVYHPLPIPLDPNIVFSFGSRVSQQKKKMEIIGPCLSTIVTQCPNIDQTIGINLIASLLTRPL